MCVCEDSCRIPRSKISPWTTGRQPLERRCCLESARQRRQRQRQWAQSQWSDAKTSSLSSSLMLFFFHYFVFVFSLLLLIWFDLILWPSVDASWRIFVEFVVSTRFARAFYTAYGSNVTIFVIILILLLLYVLALRTCFFFFCKLKKKLPKVW